MLDTRPSRPAPCARPCPRGGWLVAAGLLLVTVLLSALNANTFAVHAGSAGHDPHLAGHPAATSEVAAAAERPGTGGAEHGTSSGGTHVLHVLGACLALLAAAVALAASSSFRVPRSWVRPSARRVTVVPVRAGGWRGPPALSPPTTSPVLRN